MTMIPPLPPPPNKLFFAVFSAKSFFDIATLSSYSNRTSLAIVTNIRAPLASERFLVLIIGSEQVATDFKSPC